MIKLDARDWTILAIVGLGFIASWVYVFIHPSVSAYGICIGATGTFGGIFHWLSVRDDKTPDVKNGS